MNVLDLFSGIGGFSLGLEQAGMQTIGFCEIEPYCQSVLGLRWPGLPVHADIRELRGIRADVFAGGFPCQDISLAGKGTGLSGVRSGLWREYRRLIAENRPQWAIIENSSGITSRGLGRILLELADIGYDAEWSVLSACAFRFPHVRKRMLIVAYPQSGWREQCGRLQFEESGDPARHLHQRFDQPEPPRVADGVSRRMDRLRALGNSIIPQIPEFIGRAIMSAHKPGAPHV